MTEREIIDRIKSEQKKQGLTDREFSRLAEMGNLQRFYSGKISSSLSTVLRMSKVLKLKLEIK